jgi:hypothetical protein
MALFNPDVGGSGLPLKSTRRLSPNEKRSEWRKVG